MKTTSQEPFDSHVSKIKKAASRTLTPTGTPDYHVIC